MKRDTSFFIKKKYDLIIIGGGIFGVCAAWDAVLRGLSVALLEKRDYAHSTSANSFRMIHGGIRYIQHADFKRVRYSLMERRAFMRIAPHLAYHLPIVIPIYGHGTKGKEVLRAGFLLYDLFAVDRNRGVRDRKRHIPRGRFISRAEALSLFPGLEKQNLTGAAIFCDGQMYNPPRLAISFLLSAVNAGADAANYMEVTDIISTDGRVSGVKALDVLSGNELEVKGDIVLNTAGPWAEELLNNKLGIAIEPKGTYSRDLCFIVPRRLTGDYGLAVQGETQDPDAVLSRKKRHLFIVPWRDYSLIGVWHKVHQGTADDFTVTDAEIKGYINEINGAYPGLKLTPGDVSMWNAGLVPVGENAPGVKDLRFGKQSRIIDHAAHHGVEGLVTLIGARYTTARGDAAGAVDLVLEKLKKKTKRSTTDIVPIFGGDIGSFSELQEEAMSRSSDTLNNEVMHALVHNYGSEYKTILKLAKETPALSGRSGILALSKPR